MSAEEVLAQVAKEVSVCQKCALYHSRKSLFQGKRQMQRSCSSVRDRVSMKMSKDGLSSVRRAVS